MDLLPFDEDVLSLELDAAYKDLLVDGDRSCLYDVAKALWRLQVNAFCRGPPSWILHKPKRKGAFQTSY